MDHHHHDCHKCEEELARLRQENSDLIQIIETQAEAILNLSEPKPVPVPDSIKLVYRFS